MERGIPQFFALMLEYSQHQRRQPVITLRVQNGGIPAGEVALILEGWLEHFKEKMKKSRLGL